MLGEIGPRLKPEDEEMLRKREELAAIRATLAERELDLVDRRSAAVTAKFASVMRVLTVQDALNAKAALGTSNVS